jgi:formylglycine-generating enzyme required for sulfatase activity
VTRTSTIDGATLVYVPEGEFLMGSAGTDGAAVSNEKPQHTVYLDAFWIDRTEVTNALYAQCVQAGMCQKPINTMSKKGGSYFDNPAYVNYPVVHVSWNNARTYCGWAGRRLPTEAEWEKAARGADGRLYPWGQQAPDRTRLNFDSFAGDFVQVGRYPAGANPYGALDMAGNAWEWVADFYGEAYYAASPAKNPAGPGSGDNRVLRGGGWDSNANIVRAALRFWGSPVGQNDENGFRCAVSP